MANKRALLERYRTPGDIIAFGGRTKVAKALSSTSKRVNDDILSHNFAYGLHRFYRKPKYVNPYFVYMPREQVQIDLIDMTELSNENDGIKYLLVAKDIFTKKTWVYPQLNKKATTTLVSIKQLLADMEPFLPKKIMFDRGKEFINKLVLSLLKDKGIVVILPNTETKAAYVERVNLTIKKLLHAFMTQDNSDRYIDALPALLDTYNNRRHRSLGIFSPNEAEKDINLEKVRYIQMSNRSKLITAGKKYKPTFKVGDVVRIRSQPTKFARGYKEQFSEEYFEVIKIERRFPFPTYRLKSLNIGDNIEGIFYANELQLISGSVYQVESVLKTRKVRGKKEHLIKWFGFSDRHNSWVKAEDLFDYFL